MRKFVRFQSDGQREELSPLTFEEFLSLDLYSGASDVEWRRWLRHNELVEAMDYTDESLSDSVVEVESMAVRVLEFNPSGDEETWVSLPKLAVGAYPLLWPRDEQE